MADHRLVSSAATQGSPWMMASLAGSTAPTRR